MQAKQAVEEKVREVSVIILNLEKEIAEEESNYNDVESTRYETLNLKRKLRLFREILRSYSSSAFKTPQHVLTIY